MRFGVRFLVLSYKDETEWGESPREQVTVMLILR